MQHRMWLAGLLGVLACTVQTAAQQKAPLQFKLVDVNRAVRQFDENSVVRRPAAPGKVNLSRIYPKISLAPFPQRKVAPQMPTTFNVPSTTNPIQNKFSFIQPLTAAKK